MNHPLLLPKAPKPPTSSLPAEPSTGLKSGYSKRGKITLVACEPCRMSKTKCNGRKPVCSSCHDRGRTCAYTLQNEERRVTFLREDRRQKEQENLALSSTIQALKDADDQTAIELLHRMRRGSDIGDRPRLDGGDHNNSDALPEHPHLERTPSFTARSARTLFDSDYRDVVHAIMDSSPEETEEIVHLLKSGKDTHHVSKIIKSGLLSQPLPVTTDVEASSIEGELSSLTLGTSAKLGRDYTSYTTEALTSQDDYETPERHRHVVGRRLSNQEHVKGLLSLYFSWQHTLFECFSESRFEEDMRAGSGAFHSAFLLNAICATGSLMSNQECASEESLEYAKVALGLIQEVHQSSLSAIAAFSLLSHFEESRGKMSSMWQLSGRAMRMSVDMQLHLQRDARLNDDGLDEKSRAQVFWGSFVADVIASITLARLPSIPTTAVTVKLPHMDEEEDARPWHPYQMQGLGKPGARSSTFNRLAALAKLINSTLYLFFAPTQRMNAVLLGQEHQKYLDWLHTLPQVVASVEDAPPHVIYLHMQYHAAIVLLLRPFVLARLPDIDPRSVCMAAANSISDAFGIHMRLYDDFGICTFQVHCLLTACSIHLINLKERESLSNIVAACGHFRTLASKIKWAAASIQIIKGLIEKWKLSIPAALEDALATPDHNLPDFHFVAGEMDSYMSYVGGYSAPVHVIDGSNEERPSSVLFSPFENQQLPLLNPTPEGIFQGDEYPDSDSAPYMLTTADMEFLNDDWLGRVGGSRE